MAKTNPNSAHLAVVLLFLVAAAALGNGVRGEHLCRAAVSTDATSGNDTAVATSRCSDLNHQQIERQYEDIVKRREKRHQPLSAACTEHVKRFLCVQCESTASGKKGSWQICDSKCQDCKLLPMFVPTHSSHYKICC